MRIGTPRVFALLALLCLGVWAPAVRAAPVPVEIKLTGLRAVQTYNLDKAGKDGAYVLVGGVAKGQDLDERFPKDKAWDAAPKQPAVTDKEPIALWKGELADGEFALVTVSLFQGKGTDAAKVKEYLGKLDPSEKPAKEKKSLADVKEMRTVATQTLKAQQELIAKIKDTFARDKNTDHFGGLFNVLVWNNNGKLVKRLDPVGLTFGEHYGTDVKVYTKLKNTLPNVLVQSPGGEWALQSLAPLSDDQLTVRVKMLDTEFVKTPERTARNVTDYLADVQLTAGGKPVKWTLNGEQSGVDDIHTYWDWAE